jgi:RNA polymerase sigma-70 factor (ECF subfamily)
MGPAEVDLMELWRQGDPAAFEDLVRRWERPIARLLGRLLGRADLVPDSCQEVFLRVLRARPNYRENGSFGPWLYQIALNVARDAIRRSNRIRPLGRLEPADPRQPAETRYGQQETVELVRRAVAELPTPLREVLVLRHYEGMKFEEIARLTATPASTLKSRFAVALNRLRNQLVEIGLDLEETAP